MSARIDREQHDIQQGFTPGPWTTAYAQERGNYMVCEGTRPTFGESGRIAQCMDKADAQLCAAAPTLYYAALTALAYILTQDMSERGKAVAEALIDAITRSAD